METEKVFYEELVPQEFRERVARSPIAYLPLGTLEYHGEHLPLGADGLQSRGFFAVLARRMGGIVLPMLFLGPDRSQAIDGKPLYGMDAWTKPEHLPDDVRRPGQLAGSAYWVSDEIFGALAEAALAQIARAGFRILVAHGHGPSTAWMARRSENYSRRFGLVLLHCWGPDDARSMGIQCDHAGFNETSLTMAVRPDLVQMGRLPGDRGVWPVAVGGRDPREASREAGLEIIERQAERMAGLLEEALARVRPPEKTA